MNWLMATVHQPNASDELAESEPVLIEDDGYCVTLTLDDGQRIVMDRSEFDAARRPMREAA